MSNVVIIGAGHAGVAAAAALRQYGYGGAVTLIGNEAELPYQRPPLSKGWLLGSVGLDEVLLRGADFYAEQQITLRLGCTVSSIDRRKKYVHLSSGERVDYEALILASGSRAIQPAIAGIAHEGVVSLRSVRDAQKLRALLTARAGGGPGTAASPASAASPAAPTSAGLPAAGVTLAIVGAGYVGLEVAASARQLGAEVIVIEREPRVLARVAAPAMSAFLMAEHERHGVRFALGRAVAAIEADGGLVNAVVLDNGRRLAADAVLIGVGGTPNDALAQAAGLRCDGGVLVDLQARTDDPAIYAIGDVTRRPMPLYGCQMRLESVPNATEQARQAACAIVGRAAPAPEVPWQWSDQYDLRIQIAGHALDADQQVVRGDVAAGKFAIFHFKGEQLRAVEAVNATPEFMAGRQWLGKPLRIDRARLAETAIPLRQLAAA
ncbi:NAD(P)/FAD-dependent oxidoreductase [Duganella guangzhouensis]|uniref:NAD(P)/FAD-dependent oxidoreductase n=1 Tax=Duganella guangzhouensis TaxID=2666084 RepID=UPI0035310ED4